MFWRFLGGGFRISKEEWLSMLLPNNTAKHYDPMSQFSSGYFRLPFTFNWSRLQDLYLLCKLRQWRCLCRSVFPLAIFLITVFPRIVSTETILFWKWKMWKFSYSFRIMAIFYFINWIVAAKTIQAGKLFKREETIRGNTVCGFMSNLHKKSWTVSNLVIYKVIGKLSCDFHHRIDIFLCCWDLWSYFFHLL